MEKTMEINWLIIAVVLVGLIALILYLIKKNQKDKKDVTKFFNTDTTIRKESELDEDEDY
jgi:FtsZ-interacting cell division protein ZipA